MILETPEIPDRPVQERLATPDRQVRLAQVSLSPVIQAQRATLAILAILATLARQAVPETPELQAQRVPVLTEQLDLPETQA